jgi:hypothetical protein
MNPYNRAMGLAMTARTVLRLGFITIGLACLLGCRPLAAKRQQLGSRYALDRARAAVELAEAGDAQAIDALIELLNDGDRAVRMYTILALERLCGETYGYNYYDPEPERAAAVARWQAARQRGEVKLHSASLGTETGAGRQAPVDPHERNLPADADQR